MKPYTNLVNFLKLLQVENKRDVYRKISARDIQQLGVEKKGLILNELKIKARSLPPVILANVMKSRIIKKFTSLKTYLANNSELVVCYKICTTGDSWACSPSEFQSVAMHVDENKQLPVVSFQYIKSVPSVSFENAILKSNVFANTKVLLNMSYMSQNNPQSFQQYCESGSIPSHKEHMALFNTNNVVRVMFSSKPKTSVYKLPTGRHIQYIQL
jgi:hypothetical protein